MISLQELLEKYKPFGFTDFQIIEAYFVENKLEDQGIELMNSLSRRQIKFLHEKCSYFKEDLEYCKSILYNLNISEKDKRTLFELVVKFTYYKDLNEEELKEVKRIFDTNNIRFCPVYFVSYLIDEGVIDRERYSYQDEMLRGVIKRRDG